MTDLITWAQENIGEAVAAGGGTSVILWRLLQWGFSVRAARVAAAKEDAKKKEEEAKAFRDLVLEKLDAAKDATAELAGSVDVMAAKLEEHDRRTVDTAAAARHASEGIARLQGEVEGLRGEVRARVSRAEEDASNAIHLAQESHALSTNAHVRLDALAAPQPAFGNPVSNSGR